jgi:hypothetical protein
MACENPGGFGFLMGQKSRKATCRGNKIMKFRIFTKPQFLKSIGGNSASIARHGMDHL